MVSVTFMVKFYYIYGWYSLRHATDRNQLCDLAENSKVFILFVFWVEQFVLSMALSSHINGQHSVGMDCSRNPSSNVSLTSCFTAQDLVQCIKIVAAIRNVFLMLYYM